MKFRWHLPFLTRWFDPWGHTGALFYTLCRLTAACLVAGLVFSGAPLLIGAAAPPVQMASAQAQSPSPSPTPAKPVTASASPARTYIPFTASPETASPTPTPAAATAPAHSKTPAPSLTPTPVPTPTSTPVYTGRYVLVVYKGSQVVVAYAADEAGNYDPTNPLRKMICSTGASGRETPSGSFSISNKYIYRKLDGAYGQYASRFYGGCLFHSVPISTAATTMEAGRSMMSVAGYNKLGRKASHGCIRMLVRDAKWIYSSCPSGTKVIVTADSSPVGGGSKPALINRAPYTNGAYGWDPTDPYPSNPYNNNVIFTESVRLSQNTLTVEAGATAQLTATVLPDNAYDTSVTWLSSQGGVATVDNGTVTGVLPGQAVITVITHDGGWNASCTVTVIAPTPSATVTPFVSPSPTLPPTATPTATPAASPTPSPTPPPTLPPDTVSPSLTPPPPP